MNGRLRRMMTTVLSGGGGAAPYSTTLIDTYGANEVWPLVDIVSGSVIGAKVAAARNGAQTGWALQNAAGPVPNTLAPLSGTGDYGNIKSSNGTNGLVDIFNGATGSAFCWAKVSAAGIWTDGAAYKIFRFFADANNYILVGKSTTNNILEFYYNAGGTTETITTTFSDTGWFSVGVSWDRTAGANGEFKAFVNGAQVGTTQTALGTWSGAGWGTGTQIVGANTLGTNQNFSGWLAYPAVKFGSVWSAADFLAMHTDASSGGAENP